MQGAEAPAPEAYWAYVQGDGAEYNAAGDILMVDQGRLVTSEGKGNRLAKLVLLKFKWVKNY